MPKISSERQVERRLRFRDLQVFLAVVQHGSMGKAAAQLGMTQPSVSELIAGLETVIGARLFDRSSHGVEPTLYGQALRRRAIASVDELKQGLRDLEYLANPAVGEIRIGCPDSIASTILSRMITDFCRDYPRISLRFDQVPTPTLEVPALQARKLDIVISWLSTSKDEFGDELSVETLFDDEVVVAAGRSSHWARKRKISLSDLAEGPWTSARDDGADGPGRRVSGCKSANPAHGSDHFLGSSAAPPADHRRLSHRHAKITVASLARA
jgi:DNA-binding transcriptional LysR family regulator